jgi:hypothetical protein
VDLALDRHLEGILTTQGVPHELHVYPAYTHEQIALDGVMLARVREWYRAHGVF